MFNFLYVLDNYDFLFSYYLKNVILNCGPIAIKIVQCLCSRGDIFPVHVSSVLSSLTTDVVYCSDSPFYFLCKLGSLGFDVSTCTQIGSGTIAIVYLTKVSDVSVVVKIKRPGIDYEISRSFRLVNFFCMVYGFFGSVTIVDKLEKLRLSLLKQTDFVHELTSLEYFYEMYNTSDSIIIPEPFREYCSSDVITMSYIDGLCLDDLCVSKKKFVGASLWKFAFDSCFIHGTYHSDLHKGNLLLTRDNKLCVLDYGLTGTLCGFKKSILFNYNAFLFKKQWGLAAKLFVSKMVDGSSVLSSDCLLVFISEVELILESCLCRSVPQLFASICELEVCCSKHNTKFNNNYCDFELAFSTLTSTLYGLDCRNVFVFDCC